MIRDCRTFLESGLLFKRKLMTTDRRVSVPWVGGSVLLMKTCCKRYGNISGYSKQLLLDIKLLKFNARIH